MSEALKQRVQSDMKTALKAGDKRRLGVIRLLMAAIKQREVDERIELDDADVLAVIDKMVKQRRDSITQYQDAGRQELADQEQYEIEVLGEYLPEALGEAEIAALIETAIAQSGALSMRDMGKVMGILKPQLQGRADVGAVSAEVKKRLAG
ncbi:MAG: GatB/YqeY domain-containing protein [Proteobacteria bacterium]|nr:MAG: GatB/YqeY domain-containing protein [Pseudomonadota bacterium]QKK10448.1 MAG: GatB/YqeY domain-containing protein [Pseudomonadota bacterium]